MTFSTPTPVKAVVDGSLSDLLAHWIEEQLQHDDRARHERPYIGIMAAGGTLRDGGWPIYGGDAVLATLNIRSGNRLCRNDNHASIDCRCRGNQDTIRSGEYVPPLPHAHQLIFTKEKIIL
jgi:hypothetical protein